MGKAVVNYGVDHTDPEVRRILAMHNQPGTDLHHNAARLAGTPGEVTKFTSGFEEGAAQVLEGTDEGNEK